jgi:hypothetical protein
LPHPVQEGYHRSNGSNFKNLNKKKLEITFCSISLEDDEFEENKKNETFISEAVEV